MSVDALCLVLGCAIPVLFVVGGTVLAARFFGRREAEGWDEFDDLSDWERQ